MDGGTKLDGLLKGHDDGVLAMPRTMAGEAGALVTIGATGKLNLNPGTGSGVDSKFKATGAWSMTLLYKKRAFLGAGGGSG